MKKLPLILIFILAFFILISRISLPFALAQEEISEEEVEYLILENNLFCNDFELNDYHDQGGTAPEGARLQSESSDDCNTNNETATIELKDVETKQPDFSFMDSRLKSTRPKLMPLQLEEKVDLDEEQIETRAKHFFVSNDELSSCTWYSQPAEKEEIVAGETQVTLSTWWASLLSGTKIFCGLFSASKERCTPPEKLAIRVERPSMGIIEDDIDPSSPCSKSQRFTKETPPKLVTDPDEKKVGFFSRLIEKIFSKEETSYNIIEETASLTNKTRGVMVGGRTLTNQSEFLSNFISYGINSSIGNSPLVSNAKYEITGLSIKDENEANKEHYQEQNQVRGRNCLQLCALYPPKADFNISDIDPICESCNPEDYKAE